jgi:demethylmenaquinone methyltransferase/2-methoxy-6-polyprenyl-1,4-benzoquinol methylase
MRMSTTRCVSITQQEKSVQERGQAATDPRIAFFDHHAPTWDADADEVARTLSRLRQLCGNMGLRPGQSVLEVGCGTGRITCWLAETVKPGRVVAMDFSPAMLRQAQARGVNANFRLFDICGETSMEEQFDVVLCFHAFPHFRDHRRALCNIRNLLAPGGQLVILHLASSAELNEFHAQVSHPVCHDHMPEKNRWPGMLAACGLRLLSLTDEPGLFLLKAVSSSMKQ